MDTTSTAPEPSNTKHNDSRFSRVVYEGADRVRKRGDAFRLRREVEAMLYVKSRTSLPVPAILDTCIDEKDDDDAAKSQHWILMQRLPGCQMSAAWPTMCESARAQTTRELKSYLEELHRLRPAAPGWIGSCSGGPAYDHRLNNMATCGPFASVGEFHDFLVAPLKSSPRPDLAEKYRCQLPDTHGIVFAHADLSWANILVDPETGGITGIIDWEMAGFWPEWWEYRKALIGGTSRLWWINIVKKVMKEYPNETDADVDLEWC